MCGWRAPGAQPRARGGRRGARLPAHGCAPSQRRAPVCGPAMCATVRSLRRDPRPRGRPGPSFRAELCAREIALRACGVTQALREAGSEHHVHLWPPCRGGPRRAPSSGWRCDRTRACVILLYSLGCRLLLCRLRVQGTACGRAPPPPKVRGAGDRLLTNQAFNRVERASIT